MIGRQPKKKSRNQFRKVEEAHLVYVLRFVSDAFLVITQGVEISTLKKELVDCRMCSGHLFLLSHLLYFV